MRPLNHQQTMRAPTIKLIVSAAVTIVIACAPIRKDDSTTRSLDNLAATSGGYKTNKCGASWASIGSMPKSLAAKADRVTAYSTDLKLAALNALHHVPAAISDPFFARGGRIELLPNSTEACRGSTLTAKERSYIKEAAIEVDSCWMAADKGGKPVLILPADEDKVRHNLLRVLVYFYNEYLVARLDKATASSGKHKEFRQALANFDADKIDLMEAFLEDAAVYNLNASKKLWDLRSSNEARFAGIVLAEAIDSFYCSKTTHSSFGTSFPRTWKMFTNKKGGSSFAAQLGPTKFSK